MPRTFFFMLLFFLCTGIRGQDFPTVEFVTYAQGLSSPVDIVGSPFGNNDLYIVQRGTANGTAEIRVVKQGEVLPTPFLIVTGISCCGERGLLSMVFHPNVLNNGIFFVYYTGAQTGALTIARYKLKDPLNIYEADPNSREVIISIPHSSYSNHNGGKLLFGTDGYLYVGTGDGGGSNDPLANGQNPQSLLGKMLRIHPSLIPNATPKYSIPPDNPYANTNDGVLDEIYSMGLRNPWRWSFDRQTGNAWIADVGQNIWEELNFVTPGVLKGANFGWRCFEGTATNNAAGIQPCNLYGAQQHTPPVYVYPHNSTTGGFSVTGGYVYRGSSYPALKGFYIMADYITPAIWLVKSDGSFQAQRQAEFIPSNISGFGETADGELWAISLTAGRVYSVKAEEALSANHLLLRGRIQHQKHYLYWTDYSASGNEKYTLEVRDGNEGLFRAVESIPARGPGKQDYEASRPVPAGGVESYYRLKIETSQPSPWYSQVLQLGSGISDNLFRLIKVQSGLAYLQLPVHTQSVTISDISGRLLQQIKTGSGTTLVTIDISQWQGRVLIVSASYTGKTASLKLMNLK